MGKKNENCIFDNTDFSVNRKEAEIELIERHSEDFPEDKDWEPSDDEILDEIGRMNRSNWDDASYDLKKFFNENGPFVAVGNYISNYPDYCSSGSGGCILHNFNDLISFLKDCDYISIWDRSGRLEVSGSHHDGTKEVTVYQLTERGKKFLEKHENVIRRRELCEKLVSKGYSKRPMFAKKVFGC